MLAFADNWNKNCEQIEKLESLSNSICKPHLLYHIATKQRFSLSSSWISHSVAFTLQITVPGVDLNANTLPIIHYSLLIIDSLCLPSYLCVCQVVYVSTLLFPSFLNLFPPLSWCLPLQHFAYFKGIFTMCHTGSWAPLNKSGSRPLWGLRNKRVRGVPREWPPHFSDHNTLPKNSPFPWRRQW